MNKFTRFLAYIIPFLWLIVAVAVIFIPQVSKFTFYCVWAVVFVNSVYEAIRVRSSHQNIKKDK